MLDRRQLWRSLLLRTNDMSFQEKDIIATQMVQQVPAIEQLDLLLREQHRDFRSRDSVLYQQVLAIIESEIIQSIKSTHNINEDAVHGAIESQKILAKFEAAIEKVLQKKGFDTIYYGTVRIFVCEGRAMMSPFSMLWRSVFAFMWLLVHSSAVSEEDCVQAFLLCSEYVGKDDFALFCCILLTLQRFYALFPLRMITVTKKASRK